MSKSTPFRITFKIDVAGLMKKYTNPSPGRDYPTGISYDFLYWLSGESDHKNTGDIGLRANPGDEVHFHLASEPGGEPAILYDLSCFTDREVLHIYDTLYETATGKGMMSLKNPDLERDCYARAVVYSMGQTTLMLSFAVYIPDLGRFGYYCWDPTVVISRG